MGIGSVLIGNFIKDKPTVRTKVLSVGVIIRALFILFIVILGDKLASNYDKMSAYTEIEKMRKRKVIK